MDNALVCEDVRISISFEGPTNSCFIVVQIRLNRLLVVLIYNYYVFIFFFFNFHH